MQYRPTAGISRGARLVLTASLATPLLGWLMIGCTTTQAQETPSRAPVSALPSSPAAAGEGTGVGDDGSSAASQPSVTQQAVCDRFAEESSEVDTRTDTDPGVARLRAARKYGTEQLIRRLAGEGGSDPDWALLTAHESAVSATATPLTSAGSPPSQTGKIAVGSEVERRAHGRDGWMRVLAPVTVYCLVERHADGWQVATVDVSVLAGS